jgi:choline kinase
VGVVKAVILAAGNGSRLAPLTSHCPKPLLKVRGRPLIDYTIESLAQAGIREIIVVVGYLGHKIEAWLGNNPRHGARVTAVFNPDYEAGNATSLLVARELLEDQSFVLAMSDHLVEPNMVAALLATDIRHNWLCVDRAAKAAPQVNDATKVFVAISGLIKDIGKKLKRWNAVDTGLFLLHSPVFEAIEATASHELDRRTISRAMKWLIDYGPGLGACDVSGSSWLDVDTPEDLAYAEANLKRVGL